MKYNIQERVLMALMYCRDIETSCRKDFNFLLLLDDTIHSERMERYYNSLREKRVIVEDALHPSKIPLCKSLTRFRDVPEDMTNNFFFYTFSEMCKELALRIMENPALISTFGGSINDSFETLNKLVAELKE